MPPHTATNPFVKCCYCRWWQGTTASFNGVCANPATANEYSAFNDTCPAFEAPPPRVVIDSKGGNVIDVSIGGKVKP